MRVLFTCVVGFGHFNPMVPLARAFAAAGHEVAFATDPGFCSTVESAGFASFPAGLDHRVALARFLATTPDWESVAPDDRPTYQNPGMFGRVRVPPMLADLRVVLAQWTPDLLIHDSAEMAGAIAAEIAGIPHVEHSFGLLRPLALRRASTDVVAPMSADAGVRNPGVGGLGGELYLDICPPRFQFPEIADLPSVMATQPTEVDAPPDAEFEAWIAGRDARPTVYLTLGTVFNDYGRVRSILGGITAQAVNVVVTVGPATDPAILGSQPEHVHVARFIPQAQVLRHSQVMICHAGSGAMLGAMVAAVPVLAIPQGADQFMNAERIVGAGLGLRILPDELTPEVIGERLSTLIEDVRFAAVARSFRDEIEAMPAPPEVMSRLVALVG
jgi:UDP:flavonoid glycosyltransferase YjiC (YdhE family)